jgi:hypothetical protein
MAAGLRQSTYGVHRRRSQTDNEVTRTNQRKSFLLLYRPVRNGPSDLRIKPREASQFLGIHLIALAISMRDRSQLMDVRYDDFVS